MNFFSAGERRLDVSSGFAYCTVAPTLGLCLSGAGVGVRSELGVQNVQVHVQHILAWIGVLRGHCSPSLM
jgi:hypothetical protein